MIIHLKPCWKVFLPAELFFPLWKPMSQEQLPIFVYGTLRHGQKNYRPYLKGRTIREELATCRGRLYFDEVGGYPYLAPGEGEVQGEMVTLSPRYYEQTLAALDELEEYKPCDESGSVYLRRVATVRLTKGGEARAWVYYWNRESTGVLLESGDFTEVARYLKKGKVRKTAPRGDDQG
jgi:gamma-glutamylcyclotransferase (GGCT)/AIG2-like uncharacterized protein YtfP